MPKVFYIRPTDQPTGRFRMIDWLESNFKCDRYDKFMCLVAFAKIKPFYKLHEAIQDWNKNGKRSEAVFGIDHRGTSYQALQYALANFDSIKILHVDYATFHPKLYIFSGETAAATYYGSSNFTSGGLETNFEGGIITEFSLPEEQSLFDEICETYLSIIDSELECLSELTDDFLNSLKERGLLLDETIRTKYPPGMQRNNTNHRTVSPSFTGLFGSFNIKPARAIPKSLIIAAAASAGIILTPASKSAGGKTTRRSVSKKPKPGSESKNVKIDLVVDGFVIQVSPHHNGEIFLSKTGVSQNPGFFGYPFTGSTVPKKPGNPTYPQREPDPVVNIRVFDANGLLVNSVDNYNLNTVYYEKKAEIRITITPTILSGLNIVDSFDNYPILVMKNSETEGCDYDMYFIAKGSQLYEDYLSICDQTLPSGGKSVARKMGWI